MPEITIEEILNDKTEKDEIIIEKNDDLKEIKEEFDNSDLFND
jgi:hypothetical protein